MKNGGNTIPLTKRNHARTIFKGAMQKCSSLAGYCFRGKCFVHREKKREKMIDGKSEKGRRYKRVMNGVKSRGKQKKRNSI